MLDGIPPRFHALVRLLLAPPASAARAGGVAPFARMPDRPADRVELGRASADEVLDLVASSLRDARPSRRVAALALLGDVEHLPRAAELAPLVRDALHDAPPAVRADAEAWMNRLSPDPPAPRGEGIQPPPLPRGEPPRSLRDTRGTRGTDPLRVDGPFAGTSPHAPPPAAQALATLDWLRHAIPRHRRTAGIVAILLVLLARLLLQ
jgi:hypothetical protein